jgi:AhpD family alkylhydroperoxidase
VEQTNTTSQMGKIASAAAETKLPLVDEQDATGDLAAAYIYCRQRTGRESVPAIIRCFCIDPEPLMRMIDFAQPLLFEDGLLGRRMKETIATWISGLNRCPYCTDSHGYYLRRREQAAARSMR